MEDCPPIVVAEDYLVVCLWLSIPGDLRRHLFGPISPASPVNPSPAYCIPLPACLGQNTSSWVEGHFHRQIASFDIRLEAQGVSLGLSRRLVHDADRRQPPNALVVIPGTPSLKYGALTLWNDLLVALESVGISVLADRLSRVDLCADVPGVPMQHFVDAYLSGKYVTRASDEDSRKNNRQGEGKTISFKSNGLRLSIYDKLAELQAHSNPVALPLLIQQRWSGQMPRHAVRVEYQIRRDGLRDKWNITSVQHYLDARPHIVKDLVKWTRFTTRKPNKKNTSREPLDPHWADIAKAFTTAAGEPVTPPPANTPRGIPDTSHLYKQAVGLMLSAAAAEGRQLNTSDEALEYFQPHLERRLEQLDIPTEVARKQHKQMAK